MLDHLYCRAGYNSTPAHIAQLPVLLGVTVNKTALVTGATGFIGSYLVRFLRSKGWKVIGSYRSRDSDSLPKGTELTLCPM
jgi:NADPH:quinone reductase-like Zn-dependent oxidoreductase